jgi:hypothetical protein
VKDDVAVSRRQQMPKRTASLSLTAEETLRKLLIRHLLPPIPRPMSVQQKLDDFAAGTDLTRPEREKKEQEIDWEIDMCFPPFLVESAGVDELPAIPDQVFEFQEHHNHVFPSDPIDRDEALILLLASDLELEPETRKYISRELQRPRYPIRPRVDREQPEFAMCIRRCKELLREAGLKSLKAEAEIAQALGISVDALRKRCQRGKA